MQDQVSPAIVLQVESRCRLDRFLAIELPEFSRTRLTELIEQQKVRVDGEHQKRSFMLQEGMAVSIDGLPSERTPHDLTPADIPLEIVYEDEDILVINKQRGLAVHPATSLRQPSLVNALLARNQNLSNLGGDFRPGIVHRLDKGTTGLVVVAKNDSAHLALARQFQQRTAGRIYLAIVHGDIQKEEMKIDAPIARDQKNRKRMAVDPMGKSAATIIRKLQRLDHGTLVSCKLETGRTHQIRVHLAAIGHPVLGDELYGRKEDLVIPMQLHAAQISFLHPKTGALMRFSCPPPADFLIQDAELLV